MIRVSSIVFAVGLIGMALICGLWCLVASNLAQGITTMEEALFLVLLTIPLLIGLLGLGGMSVTTVLMILTILLVRLVRRLGWVRMEVLGAAFPRVGLARIAIVCALVMVGLGIRGLIAVADEPEPAPLAAVFASWYGYDYITGECRGGYDESMHWGEFWGTQYEPEKGFYCSADPEVINWQIDQLEDIGVQALFVSWWGWGDTDLDGEVTRHLDTELVGHPDMHMNRGITALLDEIVAGERDIKVALIVEPFTLSQAGIHPDDLTGAQKQMVLDWVWYNYYSVYPDQMYYWQGKPLLLAFDPMRLPEDSRYTIEHWTGLPRNEFTEMWGWDWFFSPPQDIIEGMSDHGVAFVYPRFDEHYMVEGEVPWITWEPRRVNPLLDIEFYREQWQKLVDHREQVKMIVLYSWNLYGEQAHCEPSYGPPASTGNLCTTKTQAYYEAFLQGEDMP